MSDIQREQLKLQAEELGLEFPANIPTPKLQAMVNEALGVEVAPNPEPAAVDEVEEENVAGTEEDKVQLSASQNKKITLRQRVAKAKAEAMKTSIVTITNKDNRENDVMTTVHLSFENQYFGISKIVPLDVPVELEAALIQIAESTMMTLHKDEIVDGKRTGNKVPVSVKKFAISYSKEQPTED